MVSKYLKSGLDFLSRIKYQNKGVKIVLLKNRNLPFLKKHLKNGVKMMKNDEKFTVIFKGNKNNV